MATPGHKGFYVSWQSGSQQVAVMVVALLGVGLSLTLPPDAIGAWGWRVPFFVGCLIVPMIFLMRRYLTETEAFLKRGHRATAGEIFRTVATHWRLVARRHVADDDDHGLVLFHHRLHADFRHHRAASVVDREPGRDALRGLVESLLAAGDGRRVGPRRPPAAVAALHRLALVTAYPALAWLVDAPSFARLLAVELWLSFLYGSYNGAMVVCLTEIMPASPHLGLLAGL